MKHKLNYLLLFCLGIVLAAILNIGLGCSEKSSPTQSRDPDNSEYSETQSMRNLSESLITAFKSENKNDVINCLDGHVKGAYSDILINSTKSLPDFGAALEKRKLVFTTELFAEYEISINGETYTIAYGNGGDDVWKLLRL